MSPQGLESHEHETGVTAAGVGQNMGHGGIGFDHVYQRNHGEIHEGKGSVLWSLHLAHDDAGVLLRKIAPGKPDVYQNIKRNGENKHDYRQARIVENPGERSPVDRQHSVKTFFAGPVKPIVLLAFFVGLKQMGAHGRRGG